MTHFEVAVLASGSKGNATVIRGAGQTFLVDVGISCRQLVNRMRDVGFDPETLSGVFLTHEHIDHVKGLETFSKNFAAPIFASAGTWAGVREERHFLPAHYRVLAGDLTFDQVRVGNFAVSHDAREPVGYTFTAAAHKLAYVTDTGFVTDAIKTAVRGADTLYLEANHDVQMLKDGSYPYVLKKRILSTKGHLDNTAAGWLLAGMSLLPHEIFLAHLSQENNRPEVALASVRQILAKSGQGAGIKIYVTTQDHTIKNFTGEDYHEQNIFA